MNSAPYPLPTYPFPADATLPYLACVPHPGDYGLALGRLSRKFLRKLRGAAERPKVDKSCGRGVESQATVLYGRAKFCKSRLKNVQLLGESEWWWWSASA